MTRFNDDPRGGRYSFQYDPAAGSSLCTAIIEAVAWVKQADPLALDPFVRTVDPDALEQLMSAHMRLHDGSRRAGRPVEGTVRVCFEYEDCAVTVVDTGEITVEW